MARPVIIALMGLVAGFALASAYIKSTTADSSTPISLIPNEATQVSTPAVFKENHFESQVAKPQTLTGLLAIASEFEQTRLLYEMANEATFVEMQAMVSEALTIPNLSDRKGALQILFSRMTDIDPMRTLDFATQPQFRFDNSLEDVIWRTWIRADFDTALAAANALSTGQLKERAANSIYFALGIHNPPKTEQVFETLQLKPTNWALYNYAMTLATDSPSLALEFINTVKSLNTQAYLSRNLGTSLADMIPQRVLTMASLLQNNVSRKQYLDAAKKRLAETDPEATISRYLGNTQNTKDLQNLKSALTQLAITDFEQATELWLQIEDEKQRLNLSSILIKQLANSDFVVALEWAQALENSGIAGIVPKAMEVFANTDPFQALQLADTYHLGEYQLEIKSAIIAAIALQDLDFALGKFRELPDSTRKMAVIHEIIDQFMPIDSDTALELLIEHYDQLDPNKRLIFGLSMEGISPATAKSALLRLPSSADSMLLGSLLTKALKNESSDNLAAFVSQFEGTVHYQELLIHASRRAIHNDPDSAMTFVSRIPAGDKKDSLLLEMIYSKIDHSPNQAVPLLKLFDSEDHKAHGTITLVANWSQQDFDSAANWVSTLPHGENRDSALLALANNAEKSSADTMTFINLIESVELQQTAIANRFRQLASVDPAKAEAFINDAPISAAWKEVYVDMLSTCYTNAAEDRFVRVFAGACI